MNFDNFFKGFEKQAGMLSNVVAGAGKAFANASSRVGAAAGTFAKNRAAAGGGMLNRGLARAGGMVARNSTAATGAALGAGAVGAGLVARSALKGPSQPPQAS